MAEADLGWGDREVRIGKLRGLCIRPEELWSMTAEIWENLNSPKAFWISKIAAKSGIKGTGKLLIMRLLRKMLQEYRRGIHALGPDPFVNRVNEPEDGMAYDYKCQVVWYSVPTKYADLLDAETPSPKPPRIRSATVLYGPWSGTK